jgi:hypothetical protein
MEKRVNLFEVLMDAICCVMCADRRVTPKEKQAVHHIMKKINCPWDDSEIDNHIEVFIQRVRESGLAGAVKETRDRLPEFKRMHREEVLLKCVDYMMRVDCKIDEREARLCEQFRADMGAAPSHPADRGQHVGEPRNSGSAEYRKFDETPSADQAVRTLFTEAIPAILVTPPAQIQEEYSRVSQIWGSKRLFEGSDSQIRSLILGNLEQLAASPAFETFRVEIMGEYAQLNAFFPKCFIGIRVWRSDERLFVCGNHLFGELPGMPDPARVGTGKTEIRVSDDDFGRALKEVFEHLLKNHHSTIFSYEHLPPIREQFLKLMGRILSGDRREGDPMPVLVEGRGDSEQEVARNTILWELSRARLIQERSGNQAAQKTDLRRGSHVYWVVPGGQFALTERGKKSVIVLPSEGSHTRDMRYWCRNPKCGDFMKSPRTTLLGGGEMLLECPQCGFKNRVLTDAGLKEKVGALMKKMGSPKDFRSDEER